MKQTLLFAFLFMGTMAMAQVKSSFGIRGGLSSASIEGDASNNLNDLIEYTNGAVTTHSRTGFFAGGYVSVPLGETMSVEPALYYSQKGYEMKGSLSMKGAEFLGVNAKAQLNTHYIDMPVVLKANVGGFQIFAGPQVSYLVQADLVARAGVLGFNIINKSMDATDEINRWDAGLTGGVGYQFTNGLNITAAYDHGLTRTDANKNLEAYNRSFKVGLGFSF